MRNDEIAAYMDRLLIFARKRCGEDAAEDMVSETMLRALYAIDRGEEIRQPWQWLCGTLLHGWNDFLRKKYHMPVVVQLDEAWDVSDEDDPFGEFTQTDEAEEVRRAVSYLARQNRELLIRYYFVGDSVAKIAGDFSLPEGTVKSRLSTGRQQVRKGMEEMAQQTNHAMPSDLRITYSGSGGKNGMPMTMVEGDKIVQNILIHAYEKPLTTPALARTLGIPTVYLEPIVRKLVDAELMKERDDGKVYTDFIIYTPEQTKERFDEQLAFCHDRFDGIWQPLAKLIEELYALDWMQDLNPRQKMKAERFAVLHALQSFCISNRGSKDEKNDSRPERPDGGSWTAFGYSYPAGYDYNQEKTYYNYRIRGGHRSCIRNDVPGVREVATFEFDTPLYDHPHRYCIGVDMADTYFIHMNKLIWKVYSGQTPRPEDDIPQSMIEAIPQYIEAGLFTRDEEDNSLKLDLPHMNAEQYWHLKDLIAQTVDQLDAVVGEELRAFVKKGRLPLPTHLDSVPEGLRYLQSTCYMEMAVVREAYERQLHMKDVDYCCPPMIVVFVE